MDADWQHPGFEPGAPVYATDGLIGIVERVIGANNGDEAWALQVRSSRDGTEIVIPAENLALSASTPREVRLAVSVAEATGANGSSRMTSTDRVVVPEHEEMLIPHV